MDHSQRHASQGEHSLRYATIYARVSTEDQGKGFSIPTQIEACRSSPNAKATPWRMALC